MTRNLKVLGLALVALLAMGAMAASSALAIDAHSEVETVELKGEQTTTNIFEVPGAGKVECTTAKFTGEETGTKVAENNYTTADVTVTPEYSGCKAFTFATAHVTMNGCHYRFFHFTGPPLTSTVEVLCKTTGATKIKITPTTFGVSACTMEIGPQVPTNGTVDMTNEGAGSSRDVKVQSTAEGIEHTKACGGNGEKDGKYTGTVTMKGFTPGTATQKGIWIE